MKKPLNQTPTKHLKELPRRAPLGELIDASQIGQVTTFGYRDGKRSIYISVVAGESETRAVLENLTTAICTPDPHLRDAVRREVKKQLSAARATAA